MTQIQHNLRNQELQELNYKLPYLLFSSGVIKYMFQEIQVTTSLFKIILPTIFTFIIGIYVGLQIK